MKKLIIALVVLLLVFVASYAYTDKNGAKKTCHQAFVYTPQASDKRQILSYTHDGGDFQHVMPADTRLQGMQKGEKVGLNLVKGSMSGALYAENYYLLGESQSDRVYLSDKTNNDSGKTALLIGCPSQDK